MAAQSTLASSTLASSTAASSPRATSPPARVGPQTDRRSGATAVLANWTAAFDDAAATATARHWARHALLDWLACALAARDEPLVAILVAEEAQGTDHGPCGLLGRHQRVTPAQAALINGAAGHALDFDDVASRMFGHPTVPVAPAALALAQLLTAQGRPVTGRALLRALIVGHEIESRLGERIGAEHYQRGFHATATLGSFGAAAACANLQGLNADQVATAFGLAATQAAGLKSMFGTMTKPLHAGKAAMNGLMSARLAARGFTARPDAIECEQGFAATQADGGFSLAEPLNGDAGFAIEQTLFKYHAACYLTHATLDAVRVAREQASLGLNDLEAMTITVSGNHASACNIAEPHSGLNIKFSIRHLAALALDGADTADLDLYRDEVARDARLGAARERIRLDVVSPRVGALRHSAQITLQTRDGRTIKASADVSEPAVDLDRQWQRLVDKARAIVLPRYGEQAFETLVTAVAQLDEAADLADLEAALALTARKEEAKR